MNKPSDQVVTEIDDILTVVWNSLDNPEELSRQLLRMTVLYAGIGNYLVEARDEERTLDRDYKGYIYQAQKKWRDQGKVTVAEAEGQAFREHRTDLDTLNHAKKRVDILKLKREDVERNIDAIRSRLSLIKGDIQRGM